MTYVLSSRHQYLCFLSPWPFRFRQNYPRKGIRKYISELTVFELRYGAENSDNPIKSHKAIDKFISGLSIVPIYGCVNEYAKTKVYLRKNGTPMHDEIDLIIGVTALVNNFTLVTDNLKDFRFLQKLKIENWIKRGK